MFDPKAGLKNLIDICLIFTKITIAFRKFDIIGDIVFKHWIPFFLDFGYELDVKEPKHF